MSSFFILHCITVEGNPESGSMLLAELSDLVTQHCEQFINITSSSSC